ncbi:MAG: aminoacetone oxidase family FAD-binding enzyme [Lachnospiraceae bacterium]|nr:aminoacetone oxidase family FAD-binding enzyme [Lachnospiraceae bacterium]
MNSDVVIIGGGMGGMCAAILLSDAGKKVTILERQERIGKKLLLTGSGKCNIGNVSMDAAHYLSDDKDKIEKCLGSFGNKEAGEFLKYIGIRLCEKNGFLYPVTRQASSVMDALRFKLEENAVNIICGSTVSNIEEKNGGYIISCEDGKSYEGKNCICACGGRAGVYAEDKINGYEFLKKAGHTVVKTAPALVQLVPQDELKAIAGIRCDAKLSLFIKGEKTAEDTGELQISEKMFSGIPVFQLSRHVKFAKDAALGIDFLPFADEADVKERYDRLCDRELEKFFAGWLNKKLAIFLIKRAGLRPSSKASELGAYGMAQLVREFKNEEFQLDSTGGYRNAQVSSGGIPLKEVSDDFESRLMPGFFIIGEMLNVCGECGGYNLHFAMASAKAAAERILCTE